MTMEGGKMKFEIANMQDPELRWHKIDRITYYKLLHSTFHVSDGKEKGARGTMLIVIDVSMSFYKILLDEDIYRRNRRIYDCELGKDLSKRERSLIKMVA